MSINYIIATCCTAYKNREKTDIYSKYVLQYHLNILERLLTPESNIKQITIVQQDITDNSVQANEYYKIEPYIEKIKSKGIKVEMLKVKNEGISYTQYIKAYLNYPNFDYYLIMEDDWIINLYYKNFDKILLDLFIKAFGNLDGFLNCWSPNTGYFVGSKGGFLCHPYFSCITVGLLNNNTFKKFVETYPKNVWDTKDKFQQLEFSDYLIKLGVSIKDLPQAGLNTKILFWPTVLGYIQDYTEDSSAVDPLFVPIQYYYKLITYKNEKTHKKSVIENKDNYFLQ